MLDHDDNLIVLEAFGFEVFVAYDQASGLKLLIAAIIEGHIATVNNDGPEGSLATSFIASSSSRRGGGGSCRVGQFRPWRH